MVFLLVQRVVRLVWSVSVLIRIPSTLGDRDIYMAQNKIRCFSHVHNWQTSGVAVMPTVGEFKGHLGMNAISRPLLMTEK